jgi:membrane protease YdiL (CAAX protease family)
MRSRGLSDLAGSYLLASIVSVVAFGLAHVPMWGWPPAATTIVSGGVLTVVYLWRQDSALILAHIATDLYGIVLAPHLARALANWPMLCRGLGVNYLSPDRRARRVSRWRPMQ